LDASFAHQLGRELGQFADGDLDLSHSDQDRRLGLTKEELGSGACPDLWVKIHIETLFRAQTLQAVGRRSKAAPPGDQYPTNGIPGLMLTRPWIASQ